MILDHFGSKLPMKLISHLGSLLWVLIAQFIDVALIHSCIYLCRLNIVYSD